MEINDSKDQNTLHKGTIFDNNLVVTLITLVAPVSFIVGVFFFVKYLNASGYLQ